VGHGADGELHEPDGELHEPDGPAKIRIPRPCQVSASGLDMHSEK
jgi:hypothetical protein